MNKKQWEIYYDALKVGEWEKALGALNKILKEDPKNSQVHLKIGDVFQKAGDKSNAIAAYNQSARLLIEDGFAHKAIAIFKIILRLDPENEEAIEQSEKLVQEFEKTKKRHEPVGPSGGPLVEETLPENIGVEIQAPDFSTADSSFSVTTEDFIPEAPFDQPASVSSQDEDVHDHSLTAESEIKPDSEQETGTDASPPGEFGFGFEAGGITESAPVSDVVSGTEEKPSPGQEEPADFGLPVESEFGLDKEQGIEFEQPGLGEFGVGYEEGSESGIPPVVDSAFGREATEEDPILSAPSFEPEEQATAVMAGQIPSFLSFLPESEAIKFMKKTGSVVFSPNEVVVKEGGIGDSVFIVKSGNAKVVVHIIGREIELATLSSGDVFGEVAFLTGRPRTASVIAVGDLEVIEFNKSILQEILETYPDTLRKMEDFFQYHLHDTLDKVKAGIKNK